MCSGEPLTQAQRPPAAVSEATARHTPFEDSHHLADTIAHAHHPPARRSIPLVGLARQ